MVATEHTRREEHDRWVRVKKGGVVFMDGSDYARVNRWGEAASTLMLEESVVSTQKKALQEALRGGGLAGHAKSNARNAGVLGSRTKEE